jgi:hypothetical protein
MIMIAWDSITLKNMDRDKLIRLENEGFDWSLMGLEFDEVEIVAPRDTEEETESTYKAIHKDIYWESMDEEGQLIAEILGDADGEYEEYEVWETYLNETLKFPFKAENYSEKRGVIPFEAAVKVLKVHSIDDWYGILMSVSYKNHVYQLPLADLECVNKGGVNDSAVSLYDVWFSNKD